MRQIDQETVMREAYWSTIQPGDGDWGVLSEYVERLGFSDPSPNQVKAFYMVIDYSTFSTAQQWSFYDTPVRDDLYTMVHYDREATLLAMNEWAQSAGIELGEPKQKISNEIISAVGEAVANATGNNFTRDRLFFETVAKAAIEAYEKTIASRSATT